jgi:hypothetical protein
MSISLVFLFSLAAEASSYPSWSLALAFASLSSSKSVEISSLRLQAPDEVTGFGGSAVDGLTTVVKGVASVVPTCSLSALVLWWLVAVAGQHAACCLFPPSFCIASFDFDDGAESGVVSGMSLTRRSSGFSGSVMVTIRNRKMFGFLMTEAARVVDGGAPISRSASGAADCCASTGCGGGGEEERFLVSLSSSTFGGGDDKEGRFLMPLSASGGAVCGCVLLLAYYSSTRVFHCL